VGAAIQGAVLAGEVRDVVLLDVTPLSLGIETLGGVSTTLIPRNTTIPTRKSEVFSTASDSQTTVEVHVLQGERPMAGGNKTIGRFHLDGLPPAPRGVPQIEVAFDIDANGILHVSAKDRATAKEQSIRIEASSGLNEGEIQQMVKDAEEHAGEDKKRREEIEARNRGDQLAYEVEKNLKEHGSKLDPALKSRIESNLSVLKDALKTENAATIASATESLQQAWHEAAAAMYQQAGAAAGAGASAEGAPASEGGGGEGKGKKGDGPVDADYEVVN
jgi:molecular chaperone DnaK